MFLFRRISLYGVVAGVLLGAVLPVAHASAQAAGSGAAPVRPPLSLVTSPLPLNVITKPGKAVTADIRVKNNGTQPETLRVELLKFGASGDTGRPQLQDRDPKDQYFNWVSFSENLFTAEPNVWKTIKMTVNPPKEAAFGYYYAVLFTRANPDKPSGGASAVEGGVASLVLLNVDAPGARREAKVAELVATQKVYEFLPAKFTVKLRNAGNVHVSPTGTMFIKRGSSQVGTLNFNEERGNILPGTNRVFNMAWADGFPAYQETSADGKTKGALKWDFSKVQKLRFGRYTAHLVAVYDDGQRDVPIEAEVAFWVIPWRILGVILLILLIIGAGIWGIGRVLWRAIRRKAATVSPAPVGDDISDPDEPDPNSLAAAARRRKTFKEKALPAQPEQEVSPKPEPVPRQEAILPQQTQQHAGKKSKHGKRRPAPAESGEPRSQADVNNAAVSAGNGQGGQNGQGRKAAHRGKQATKRHRNHKQRRNR
jgi:hypothetical protein